MRPRQTDKKKKTGTEKHRDVYRIETDRNIMRVKMQGPNIRQRERMKETDER